MKITVTLDNCTPEQFRIINELFAAPAIPAAPVITPEDSALAGMYNKLASPEHAKITHEPNTPPIGHITNVVNTHNAVTGTYTPTAPEVDSSGLQYDERIHSGTKAKNKDGSWKQRRGVDDATIAAVESELLAKYTVPPAPPAAPAIPPAPVHADVEAAIDAMNAAAAIPPAPVPAFLANVPGANATAPATVLATSVASVTTGPAVNFSTLTHRITTGLATRKIDGSYPTTVCTRVGSKFGKVITSLTDIMNDQAMIEYADSVMTLDNAGF